MSSKQYLKKLEGTSTPIATRYKPAFSDSEYTGFGELYRNGKWYKDVAVFADDFNTNTISNYTAKIGTEIYTINDGKLTIDGNSSGGGPALLLEYTSFVVGKRYKILTNITSTTDTSSGYRPGIYLRNSDNTSTVNNTDNVGIDTNKTRLASLEFIAGETTLYVGMWAGLDSTAITTFDYFTIIPLNDDGSIDISNATELTTPQTYLPIEVDVDEQGNLLNVDRMDLPTLVEDYVSTKKASIETLNIGDFRNIDGSELNVWSERNSFGIRNVYYAKISGTGNISTNSTTFVDVPGLVLTVTPSKENSKFLISYTTNFHINMNTPNYGGPSTLFANGVATDIGLTFQGDDYATVYHWYTNTLTAYGVYQATNTNPITFQVKYYMKSGGNYCYFHHNVGGLSRPNMTIIELGG